MQAACKKAQDARKDLEALQASAAGRQQAGSSAQASPEVARLEKAVGTRQQKLDALQTRVNEIEDAIFAPLSEKVRPC